MLPGLYRITQGVFFVKGHKNIGYDAFLTALSFLLLAKPDRSNHIDRLNQHPPTIQGIASIIVGGHPGLDNFFCSDGICQ